MAISKWLLGGLGLMLGGPIGALIGVAAGWLWETVEGAADSGEEQEDSSYDADNEDSAGGSWRSSCSRLTGGDVRVSLLVLMACVMKADGKVLKSEVAFVKPYLIKLFGEEEALQALKLLKALLDRDIDVAKVCGQIRDSVNYSTRLELVHLLLELANADGDFDSREEALIAQIVAGTGISRPDYDSLVALYRRGKEKDWAYKALEISPSATNDEVRKAYRRMAMKYHPDKVTGAAAEVRERATEKFRAVKEAYEHIKTLRGMN